MAGTPHAEWRKSTHSDVDGNCVEVAQCGGGVAIRDSKDPAPELALPGGTWRGLLREIAAGRYDR